jgi:hypothetical protein
VKPPNFRPVGTLSCRDFGLAIRRDDERRREGFLRKLQSVVGSSNYDLAWIGYEQSGETASAAVWYYTSASARAALVENLKGQIGGISKIVPHDSDTEAFIRVTMPDIEQPGHKEGS